MTRQSRELWWTIVTMVCVISTGGLNWDTVLAAAEGHSVSTDVDDEAPVAHQMPGGVREKREQVGVIPPLPVDDATVAGVNSGLAQAESTANAPADWPSNRHDDDLKVDEEVGDNVSTGGANLGTADAPLAAPDHPREHRGTVAEVHTDDTSAENASLTAIGDAREREWALEDDVDERRFREELQSTMEPVEVDLRECASRLQEILRQTAQLNGRHSAEVEPLLIHISNGLTAAIKELGSALRHTDVALARVRKEVSLHLEKVQLRETIRQEQLLQTHHGDDQSTAEPAVQTKEKSDLLTSNSGEPQGDTLTDGVSSTPVASQEFKGEHTAGRVDLNSSRSQLSEKHLGDELGNLSSQHLNSGVTEPTDANVVVPSAEALNLHNHAPAEEGNAPLVGRVSVPLMMMKVAEELERRAIDAGYNLSRYDFRNDATIAGVHIKNKVVLMGSAALYTIVVVCRVLLWARGAPASANSSVLSSSSPHEQHAVEGTKQSRSPPSVGAPPAKPTSMPSPSPMDYKQMPVSNPTPRMPEVPRGAAPLAETNWCATKIVASPVSFEPRPSVVAPSQLCGLRERTTFPVLQGAPPPNAAGRIGTVAFNPPGRSHPGSSAVLKDAASSSHTIPRDPSPLLTSVHTSMPSATDTAPELLAPPVVPSRSVGGVLEDAELRNPFLARWS